MNILKNRRVIEVIIAVILLSLAFALIAIFRNNNNVKAPAGNIKDQYKDSLPELEAKVNINPNDVAALRQYAVALYAVGDLEDAKTQYLLELELNPNDAVLFNNLGNIYRDTGDYQNAIDSYQKSIDLNKNQTNVYANLANLYIYYLGQPDLGYGVYTKAIQNNATDKITLLMYLGNAYKDNGLKEKAIDAYNQILQIDSKNTSAQSAIESLKQI